MERMRFIQEEIDMKQARQADGHPIGQDEINFLIKTKDEVKRSLDKEKVEVGAMADGLYTNWKNILEQRKNQDFALTNVSLRVHEQALDDGEVDQIIDLKYDNNITALKDIRSSAARSSVARIQRLQMYAVLIINDQKVSKTNK